MTPQPPPTQEQFELLDRVTAKALVHLAIFDEDEVNAALRAVLAYARLGVVAQETLVMMTTPPRTMDYPQDQDDIRTVGVRAWRANAGGIILQNARALGLLAPAVEPKEKQDAE